MKKQFKKNEYGPNYLCKLSETDYVSYNPMTSSGIFEVFAPLLGEKEGERLEETALRYEGQWYILKGDFRKDVLKCRTPKAVQKFFIEKHKTHGSGWSTFNL
jgi:hypothetical protein